jgi:hypothetical protein
MLQQAEIEFLDGTKSVIRILPYDMICYERTSKKPFASKDGEFFFESVFMLAWLAACRAGQTTMTFDAWMQTVATVDMDMSTAPKESTSTELST